MKITLKQAAQIISETSGFDINRDAIRNQIVRGRWPYPHYFDDAEIKKHRRYLLMMSDVLEYAKSFNGLK